MLINLFKGKEEQNRQRNRTHCGQGIMLHFGETGHYASNCDKPKRHDNDNGVDKGHGKDVGGMILPLVSSNHWPNETIDVVQGFS